MKKVKPALFFVLVCGILLGGHTTANASTIWEPTSSKVEFILVDNGSTGKYQFALFDEVQTSIDGLNLIFDKKNSETVNFSQLPNSSDWQAKNPPDSITLIGSSRFRIALLDGTDWVADTAVWDPQNSTYTLTFGPTYPKLMISNATTVPTPTSALLLGAGIIGLIGFRRVRR